MFESLKMREKQLELWNSCDILRIKARNLRFSYLKMRLCPKTYGQNCNYKVVHTFIFDTLLPEMYF